MQCLKCVSINGRSCWPLGLCIGWCGIAQKIMAKTGKHISRLRRAIVAQFGHLRRIATSKALVRPITAAKDGEPWGEIRVKHMLTMPMPRVVSANSTAFGAVFGVFTQHSPLICPSASSLRAATPSDFNLHGAASAPSPSPSLAVTLAKPLTSKTSAKTAARALIRFA